MYFFHSRWATIRTNRPVYHQQWINQLDHGTFHNQLDKQMVCKQMNFMTFFCDLINDSNIFRIHKQSSDSGTIGNAIQFKWSIKWKFIQNLSTTCIIAETSKSNSATNHSSTINRYINESKNTKSKYKWRKSINMIVHPILDMCTKSIYFFYRMQRTILIPLTKPVPNRWMI